MWRYRLSVMATPCQMVLVEHCPILIAPKHVSVTTRTETQFILDLFLRKRATSFGVQVPHSNPRIQHSPH